MGRKLLMFLWDLLVQKHQLIPLVLSVQRLPMLPLSRWDRWDHLRRRHLSVRWDHWYQSLLWDQSDLSILLFL